MAADTEQLGTVDDALAALRAGRPVIVVDDADRENEGDILLAAETADPRWVGWAVRHSSGLLCAPLTPDAADRLRLLPMVTPNQDPRGTAYTVSVDARSGVGTGISAADRARTLRVLADTTTRPDDLLRPGHVFPLVARQGGVLERRGHTEAAVDLCRLAGLAPVGVISEVVEDHGGLSRMGELVDLGRRFSVPVISIEALARHLDARPGWPVQAQPRPRVERAVESTLVTAHGTVRAIGYRDLVTGAEHVALISGRPPDGALVRVHSECLTGEAFGSLRCDCRPQLDEALRLICQESGVVVYLRGHEGRGIGLLNKIAAYGLQDQGRNTVEANLELGEPADAREYGAAGAVLTDLGLASVTLLTNNPGKVDGLERGGVKVIRRVGLLIGRGPYNEFYLDTKRDTMGHVIPAAMPQPCPSA